MVIFYALIVKSKVDPVTYKTCKGTEGLTMNDQISQI